MSRMNWRRITDRDRMRRQGTEDIAGATAFHVPQFEQPKYRLPVDKAELRKQAAAAFLQWRARQRPMS